VNEDLTGRRVHQKLGESELGPLIGVVRDVRWQVTTTPTSYDCSVGLLVETPDGDLIVVAFDKVRVAK
jgi:hypothetical protein